jgi:hypothetical protein
MVLKSVACLFAALALAGCCMSGNGCYAPLPGVPVAWDGLGPPPSEDGMASERTPKKRPKTQAVSRVDRDAQAAMSDTNPVPSTRERWAQQEAADRIAEQAMAKKLIICRGCSPAPAKDQDATGSVRRAEVPE